jgi:hypothetical protein
MSKRSFADADLLIPKEIWALFPELEHELNKLQKIEDDIGRIFTHRQRTVVVESMDAPPTQKVCRVYVRHEFVPTNYIQSSIDKQEKVKAYCLLTIEGCLLDSDYSKKLAFGSLWEKIQLSISDKKHNLGQLNWKWTAASNPAGKDVDAFRFRIPIEKAFSATISLHRATDVQTRYEASPQLIAVLPNLPHAFTLQEVLLALVTYVSAWKLWEDKDKDAARGDTRTKVIAPLIKADAKLQTLFQREGVTQVRTHVSINEARNHLLRSHLKPCEPLKVEVVIEKGAEGRPTSSRESNSKHTSESQATHTGGPILDLTFDVEVSVPDVFAMAKQASAADAASQDMHMLSQLTAEHTKAHYLVREMCSAVDELNALSHLQADPLSRPGQLAAFMAAHTPRNSGIPVYTGLGNRMYIGTALEAHARTHKAAASVDIAALIASRTDGYSVPIEFPISHVKPQESAVPKLPVAAAPTTVPQTLQPTSSEVAVEQHQREPKIEPQDAQLCPTSCTAEEVLAANSVQPRPPVLLPPLTQGGMLPPIAMSGLCPRTFLDVGCDSAFQSQEWVSTAAWTLLGKAHGGP